MDTPKDDSSAVQRLQLTVDHDDMRVVERCHISFQRTLRVPEDKRIDPLPYTNRCIHHRPHSALGYRTPVEFGALRGPARPEDLTQERSIDGHTFIAPHTDIEVRPVELEAAHIVDTEATQRMGDYDL
jgi:hypothetical protein